MTFRGIWKETYCILKFKCDSKPPIFKNKYHKGTVTRGESGLVSGNFLWYSLRIMSFLMIHDFLFCSVGEQASIKPPQFIEWIYWICSIAVIWLHQMYRFTPPWGESGLGSISLKSTLSWFTPPGVNRDKQLSNVSIASLSVSPLLVMSLDSKRRVQAQGGHGTPLKKGPKRMKTR